MQHGVAPGTVRRLIQRNGVLRTRSQAYKKYTINESIFDAIDTEEKAYWLGFLYADGCNYRPTSCVSISLQERDRYILERFRAFLDYSGPVETEPARKYQVKGRKGGIGGGQARLTVRSIKISDALLKWGVKQAKTFDLDFPHWLPEPYMAHFIRGFFDGDGTIGAYSLAAYPESKTYGAGFVGYAPFIEDMRLYLEKRLGIKLLQYPKGENLKTHELKIGGRNKVISFCRYIYEDATVYLLRKRARYDSILTDHFERMDYPFGNGRMARATALEIHTLLDKGTSPREILKTKGVTPGAISKIKMGQSWADVTGRTVTYGRQKLTNSQVIEIVEMINQGYLVQTIAEKFSACHETIYNIRSGRSWGNVTGIERQNTLGIKGSRNPSAKLTEQTVLEIKKMLEQGRKVSEVASLYGVGFRAIWAIKTGKSWAHIQLPLPLSQ